MSTSGRQLLIVVVKGHRRVESVMEGFLELGMPGATVLNAKELMEDPHLAARDYFDEVTHPRAGTHRYPGLPVRLSEMPHGPRLPSPCIGQHSRYVLAEILGMSDQEAAPLFDAGVISEGPVIT